MTKNTVSRLGLFLMCLLYLGALEAKETSAIPRKEICLTIDDLPFVGKSTTPGYSNNEHDRFYRILYSLIDANIPATGFVIAGSISKGQWKLLQTFQKSGFVIGNHTYSHESLKEIGADKYIHDIERADQRLTPLMSHKKYFRYPYLEEGLGEERKQVHQYLQANQYTVAPVTIDSRDFIFNGKLLSVGLDKRSAYLAEIKQRYLKYIQKETELAERISHGHPVKQILLIHANLLNSYVLSDVIQFYKERGYHFITLDEALPSHKPKLPKPRFLFFT